MRIHFLLHESFEAPGAIEIWAQKNHLVVSYTRFFEHADLPKNTDSFDYLIVMGGPQSPATTVEECPYFDASQEIAFIKSAIIDNKYLLGVCLGAQLIGEALEAEYSHSPNKEIGVFDVELTECAKSDPVFSEFPNKFPVGHWHGDMPGLTKQAEVLAFSQGCPRQVVKYSPRIYGFQCHFEFTPATIESMIANCSVELQQYTGLPYVETAEQLKAHEYDSMNTLLFRFLDQMYLNFQSESKQN